MYSRVGGGFKSEPSPPARLPPLADGGVHPLPLQADQEAQAQGDGELEEGRGEHGTGFYKPLSRSAWTRQAYTFPQPMKTIRIRLEDALAAEVDRAAKDLKTTRSALIRDALRAALTDRKEHELERRHRAGYERYPVTPGEFDAEARFRARAAPGSGDEGLALLDLLDRKA